MPRSEHHIPGRHVRRGVPLDTAFGTDLLDPNSFLRVSQTGSAGVPDTIEPGEPFIIHVGLIGGVNAGVNPILTNAPWKFRVLDSWVVVRGTGVTGSTAQVCGTSSGTNPITSAMSTEPTNGLSRTTTLNTTNGTIAKGGGMSVLTAGTSQAPSDVYILCMRIV